MSGKRVDAGMSNPKTILPSTWMLWRSRGQGGGTQHEICSPRKDFCCLSNGTSVINIGVQQHGRPLSKVPK